MTLVAAAAATAGAGQTDRQTYEMTHSGEIVLGIPNNVMTEQQQLTIASLSVNHASLIDS